MDSTRRNLTVCVIGAGAAGLCAARHLLADKELVSTVDVYEQATQVGGTWVYTEKTGHDEFGLPLHTSMYKSLRTNLPKEIMGFPDFMVPGEKSYLPARNMLKFLEDYADNFNVTEKIKFAHRVKLVKPLPGDRWEVTYTNLMTKTTSTSEYDTVLICNGHYNTPFVPKLKGIETFTGESLHSHDYRVPDPMTGKQVLIIGAGPSGLDIALEVSGVSPKVILSHHLKDKPQTEFPENVIQTPDVVKVDGQVIHFADGTTEEIDIIFYCTGYLYNFPFLSEECKIEVSDNYVRPLYKHLVNINYPTMAFIGIPFYVCAFSMFDLQVRYYVRALKGQFELPSREEMHRITESEENERIEKGFQRRQLHMMGPDQEKYYDSLSEEAKTENLPKVLSKIREDSNIRFLKDLKNYRSDIYRIIDDETYELVRSNGEHKVIWSV